VNAVARVAAYAGALVLVLGGSYYLAQITRGAEAHHDLQGRPSPSSALVQPNPTVDGAPRDADTGASRDADLAANATVPMSAVDRGYRLFSNTTSFAVGTAQPFRFQVLGADGRPVQELAPGQDLDLNLVVVRLDGAAFQHLAPVRDMTGTWTTPLTLPSGGSYAAWVSFTQPGGVGVVLGSYLSAAGDFQPQAVPSPAPSADVDGYRVEIGGTPAIGADSDLTLSVSRDGKPVTDLQSTDDAFAHLAVMRTGDLAYAFVDASRQVGIGPQGAPALRFSVRLPVAGTYWLFVEFRHLGQVRVAALTVTAPAPAPIPEPTPTPASAPASVPAASPKTPGGT